MVLSVSGFIGVMLLIKDHHLRPGEKVLREEPAVESGIV
jgi:hypothetical protein